MDGTLADCRHRLRWVEGPGNKNWEKFFAGSKDDKLIEPVANLALALSATNAVIIASGRPEHLRRVTEAWLRKFKVPFSEIYLRDNDDRRPDGKVKTDMLAAMRANGYEPWLAVDDRDEAVAAWRESGICCLQCELSRHSWKA
jgi:hypothetical protein